LTVLLLDGRRPNFFYSSIEFRMTGLIPFTPGVSDAAAVGIGALCGALCRHHIGKAAAERIARDQRLKHLSGWHTAGINVLGSFVLGGVFATPIISDNHPSVGIPKPPATSLSKSAHAVISNSSNLKPPSVGLTPRMKLLLGVGFCGSFTTFSTFSVDVVNMMAKGEMTKVCSYLMVNNVGGIVAAASGMMVVKKILKL